MPHSSRDDQYSTLLSVFFVPYVLTAPFLGTTGKKYSPSRVLHLMMGTFGFMTVSSVMYSSDDGSFLSHRVPTHA